MTNHKSAVISWIGDADLIDFYQALPDQLKRQFITLFPFDKNRENFITRASNQKVNMPQSPIKIILKNYGRNIREVHLITNRLSAFLTSNNCFAEFLQSNCSKFNGNIVIHSCEKELTRITELSGVYAVTQEIISSIKTSCTELYCNISSGVGVTSAALIMLSSAYFNNPHILQTYQSTVTEDPLPENFDKLILRRSIKTEENLTGEKILGTSEAIKNILKMVRKIAPFDYSVLLLGPSGAGKSTLAREIHELSSRKNGKFEYVNCGSLTKELLESKLFGHKKGAFTGAINDQEGVFKTGDKGTVFLDEVADCSLEMQATLLHVLQPEDYNHPTKRRFRPIGTTSDEISDVRVIAATNKNIKQLIKEGKFREDLYFRLATTTIIMPGLTGREDDIAVLAESILDQINRINRAVPGYTQKHLRPESLKALQQHIWTGNVRELQNVLQQAAILSDTDHIATSDLHFQLELENQNVPDETIFSLESIKADLERRYINAAIQTTGGNKAKASRLLGMKTPQNLESRIKALKIQIS